MARPPLRSRSVRVRHFGLIALTAVAACESTAPDLGEGPPVRLRFTDDVRSGLVGNFIPAPTVTALDKDGRILPDVPIHFRVDGGGVIARSDGVTDRDGAASPAGWRLGPVVGAQRLVAESGDLTATVEVEASPVPSSAFHISAIFVGPEPTSEQVGAIADALRRWEQLILGDLPSYRIPESVPTECPGLLLLRGQAIDDLLLYIALTPLPQGQVGATSICLRRSGSGLPAAAAIRIDPVVLATSSRFTQVLEHEIAHALGFGTIWANWLRERDGDLRFTGRSAESAYRTLFAPGDEAGGGVPVEMAGGQAAARSHWRESTLDRELLTSVFNDGPPGVTQPLSAITVSALRDLGYVVDDSRSDPFGAAMTPPTAGAIRGTAAVSRAATRGGNR